MDIKDIVAVMMVKINSDDKVGKLSIVSDDDNDGMIIDRVDKMEVEFYSEADFKEPSRENFEDFIGELNSDVYKLPEGVTLHFLTELKGE